MNYQLKKYPKYKPSGIEWIGEIPEHWEVKKLKYEAKIQGGYAFKSEEFVDSGIPVVRIGDISTKINIEDCKKTSGTNIPDEFKLKKYDTLIALSGATVGKMCFIEDDLNAYINQRVAKVNNGSKYLYFILTSNFFIEQIFLAAGGSAQENISTYTIGNFLIPLPPLPEQTAIANFLDDKTAKIDSLIEKKKKLIELYKEERTAVINHYVLGQHLIDNSQLTIDNGQLTINNGQLTINNYQLPKHWEVKKLKYVVKEKIQTGSTPPSNKEEYYKEEIDWFTPSDFSDDLLLLNSKRKISQLAIDDEVVKLYPCNTVLLVGIGATLGKVGYIVKKASSNQQINSISFDTLDKAKYYANFLFANQSNIVSLANASTLAILNQSQTKDIILPVPDEKDLTSIVQHIESETKLLDDKIARAEKEIELLQEYRTALINEVVTGKIKVIDNG